MHMKVELSIFHDLLENMGRDLENQNTGREHCRTRQFWGDNMFFCCWLHYGFQVVFDDHIVLAKFTRHFYFKTFLLEKKIPKQLYTLLSPHSSSASYNYLVLFIFLVWNNLHNLFAWIWECGSRTLSIRIGTDFYSNTAVSQTILEVSWKKRKQTAESLSVLTGLIIFFKSCFFCPALFNL